MVPQDRIGHYIQDHKNIDNNAFIAQSNANGVYGKGFDTMKVKAIKKHNA